MRDRLVTIALAAAISFLAGIAISRATQTNYLGTVFVADTATPAHQLAVNADGSINVACH